MLGPGRPRPGGQYLPKTFHDIEKVHRTNETTSWMAKTIYAAYGRRGEPETTYDPDPQLAGEPRSRGRARARNLCTPFGPVGLLLETAYLRASHIDRNCNFLSSGHPTVNLLDEPYQKILPYAHSIVTTNRTETARSTRQAIIGLDEIDADATRAGTRKLDATTLSKLNVLRTCSDLTNDAAFWAGLSDTKACPVCGAQVEEYDHLWRCQKLDGKRRELDPIQLR